MTTKELLHEYVDKIDDGTAEEALQWLRSHWQRPSSENVPAFAGMLHSGKGTLGRDAKRIVREEMGSNS